MASLFSQKGSFNLVISIIDRNWNHVPSIFGRKGLGTSSLLPPEDLNVAVVFEVVTANHDAVVFGVVTAALTGTTLNFSLIANSFI